MSRSILVSSLLLPDAPAWHWSTGYSTDARAALQDAYAAMRSAQQDPEAYRRAYVAVIPLRAHKLSLQQRMNAEFILAQAYASEEDFAEAAASVETALEVARLLKDQPAEVELQYLRGNVADAQLQLAQAYEHYTASLHTLQSLAVDEIPIDPAYELTLLIRSTAMSFELARYDAAYDYLVRALVLHDTSLPEAQTEAAYLVWLEAQLLRWQGGLNDALSSAMSAADHLLRIGPLMMAGRMQTIVAETALDVAHMFARHDAPGGREAFAAAAFPYAQRALQLAHQTGDRVGELLARLARVRTNRLLGRSSSRIKTVETIVRAAKRVGDDAVLGRALTILGEEFETEARFDAAGDCYQQAWRLLESHQLFAMALLPHRAFLYLREQYVE
jgi:tetratricopeptide (TPR) repeat protein